MFSGPLTKIGHQFKGKPTETRTVEKSVEEDLIMAWSRSILECYSDHVSIVYDHLSRKRITSKPTQ